MLEAHPKHILSNDYVVRSPEGGSTVLDVSSWRERAEFELGNVPHRLYREGMVSGAFVLERAGSILAKATKPSAFRSQFTLELNGESYTLRKASVFRRSFGIFSGDRQVGAIRPASTFTRRTIIDVPRDWSPAVQLFVFWLVLVIWNRDEAAATGAS